MKNAIVFLLISIVAFCCTKPVDEKGWCDKPSLVIDEHLKRPQYSNDWFQVYEIQDGIYAIAEPYQWQEVISYLVIGNEFALLFDTGNGIGNIKTVVDSITRLPVRVLNSHSHIDHIGGNADFDFIYGMDTEFTRANMQGRTHAQVATEVSPEALCKPLPVGVKAEDHHIRPYEVDEIVSEGYVIDMGNRKLKVISIPGHTPDAIGLVDEENGYLWTGDTFYKGGIWLFAHETDIPEYRRSIDRLASMSPALKYVFPAHNTPVVDPRLLVNLKQALADIESGKVKGTINKDDRLLYQFDEFSILMAK